jgi:hypothetical protein
LRTLFFRLEDHWRKVAIVIAKVADEMGTELPTGDDRYELISDCIEVLVRAGSLEALGNTKSWRFSEVRRFDSRKDDE